jgi:hypothetical protein
MRPRSIPNESVPGAELPPWERFQRFVAIISRVPKDEADKVTRDSGKKARKPGKEKSG